MQFLKQSFHDPRARVDALIIFALLTVLLIHVTDLFGTFDTYLIVGATILGVIPVFVNALRSLKEGEWASMDSLASLALIFSIIEQAWASAVFVALMLTAARLLETTTEARMERSIRGLLKLKPENAKIERNGTLITTAVSQVQVGDCIVVDTGERIAVDGVVLSGEAAIDESSLTGESLPVDKEAGSTVSSSTLVTSGSLRIQTVRVGKDTMLERIITLVESSRSERPDIETLGEKFGKIYLIGIFLGAAFLLFVTRNVEIVLAVVLVVCADDVVIAIPLTYLRAIGTAAKRGIVVKGSRHLEVLGRADTIVFDKTGTLTYGKPHVAGVVTLRDTQKQRLLELAASAAQRSTHPLSKAVCAYAKEQGVRPRDIDTAEVIGGKGVIALLDGEEIIIGNRRLMEERSLILDETLNTAATIHADTGKSISFVAKGNTVIGFFALGDTVKEDAREVIQTLRDLGVLRIVLLSGDNERAAGALASEVGIDTWFANLLPEDKVAKIKELNQGSVLAMVGDGVNDAAALSIAHVGIAMGGLGSDGAIESANIVLMHDNLNAIPQTIRLARSVKNISVQDFWIWGISNALGLTLVFVGLIGPAGAAAYNFISDFFPLFNSLRAKFPR